MAPYDGLTPHAEHPMAPCDGLTPHAEHGNDSLFNSESRDEEIAKDLKARLRKLLLEVAKLYDEAATHNMALQWQIGTVPPFNKHQIQSITVLKHL